MFYAAEDTSHITILLTLKKTMMIVILLLLCYIQEHILAVCFFSISFLFGILYNLRIDNFLLNEDDDGDVFYCFGSDAFVKISL